MIAIWLLAWTMPVACKGSPLLGREDVITLVSRLTLETQQLYDSILAETPYHPSLMAWGMHYLARACLAMYAVTNERAWLDRAINITDYFVEYSDVNGDDEPSWGAYNETFGGSHYGFAEWTVWDGVISLAIIEVAKTIRSDPVLSSDQDLASKADAYVQLTEKVVTRHWASWTEVGPGQGYYWDEPTKDLGPYVNGFAALGEVELILAQLTGNRSFLERPAQMASYLIGSMRYDPVDDLYVWDYKIGSAPAEDISHGAIDLEFLLVANQMGLVDDVHIRRICNTYAKRIWQVPNILNKTHPLAMRVDGSGEEDYTIFSRAWIRLSTYDPYIYERQRTALGIEHERFGLHPAGYVVLAAAEVALLSKRLGSMGIDTSQLRVLSLSQIEALLRQAQSRLEEYESLGTQMERARSMLKEASSYLNEASLANCSVPIAMIWEVYDILVGAKKTAEKLQALEARIAEAEAAGMNVSALWTRFAKLKPELALADTMAGLNAVNARIDVLGRGLDDLKRLQGIEALARRALEAGGELSAIWPRLSTLRERVFLAETKTALDDLRKEIDALSADVEKVSAEALIRLADEVVRRAKDAGIDTSRHEIFLQRAKEEFSKGRYGPAIQFTNYPLGLMEQLSEGREAMALALIFLLGLALRKREEEISGGLPARAVDIARATPTKCISPRRQGREGKMPWSTSC